MAEPKWTPGPWKWGMHETYNLPALYGANGEVVMDFGDDEPYYPTAGKPPNHYDQALIAAAPDLYEALELAVEKLREYADMDRWSQGEGGGCMSDPDEFIREAVEKAEAALRKARGETT